MLLPAKASQSERSAGSSLPASTAKLEVLAQLVMIVEVLVTQRQSENPLRQQGFEPVFDVDRVAPVIEALREPPYQPEAAIHLSQQKRARIGGDVAAIETGHHRAPFNRFKSEKLRATVRPHRGVPFDLSKSFSQNNFLRFGAPMHLKCLRNPG